MAPSAPRGSPALAGALEAGEERREGAAAAPREPPASRVRVPQAAAFPTATCRQSRMGDGSCSPEGMARGVFYSNHCPRGQGGFLHRVLPQRPADATPLPTAAASPARRAAMAEGPAPSSGLLRTAEWAEGRAGERRGNAAKGAGKIGSKGELRGERASGLGAQRAPVRSCGSCRGPSRLFPPYGR